MLKLGRYIYHHTTLGKFIINVFFDFQKWYNITFLDEKSFLKKKFKKRHGVYPHLDSPRTLNEKIIWLKLNDRTPLHTQCADKYLVRDYVRNEIGEEYLIPLLFQSYNSKDLIPENFPKNEPFIIKTNHDSSGGIIVKDPVNADWIVIKNTIDKQLKKNYFKRTGEWQYKNIKPCVIAEKLLTDKYGNIPFDFKLHCLNGRVVFIQVDVDRFTNHKRNFYDRNWELLPFTWSIWDKEQPLWVNGRDIDKPKQLDKMIFLSEKLAKPFAYVRIDMYNLEDQLFFGEITFHHGSGHERISPKEWDLKFGNLVDLNTIN